MTKHKSEDYKISAVQYYLEHNKSQITTCKIFNPLHKYFIILLKESYTMRTILNIIFVKC
jgi:hypothetical protein